MSVNTETNPLLEINFQIPFDRIRAEHVEPAVNYLLTDAQSRLEAIAKVPPPRTFDNTMHALDGMTEPLDFAMSVVKHLENVPGTSRHVQCRAAASQRVLFGNSFERRTLESRAAVRGQH